MSPSILGNKNNSVKHIHIQDKSEAKADPLSSSLQNLAANENQLNLEKHR